MLFLFAATIIFIGIYTPKKHDIYKKEIYNDKLNQILDFSSISDFKCYITDLFDPNLEVVQVHQTRGFSDKCLAVIKEYVIEFAPDQFVE